MPAPSATGEPVPAAPSCEVRDWVVFGPGYHKGRLYTAADCRRLVANFARLSAGAATGPGLRVKTSYEPGPPVLAPAGKLGHDKAQRLARSIGLLSTGTVTGCRLTDAGEVAIDVTGVPLWLGAEVNAGRVNDGSVELADDVPDPADPAGTIPGPVLTGVSFLGEEQPAVKGYPPPRATMPDGTDPPAEAPRPPWADPDFLARLTSAPDDGASAGPGPRSHADLFGRRVAVRTYRFSEATPTGSPAVRDQLNQQLSAMGLDPAAPHWAGMTDDELKAALADMGGQQFSAAMKKKFSDAPADPPADDAKPVTMADMKRCMAEALDPLVKRVGAVEKFAEEAQKQAPKVEQAAAFAADYQANLAAEHRKRVEGVVLQAITEGRITKADEEAQVALGLTKSATRTFSDGPAKGKTEFEAWREALLSRKPSALFSEVFSEPEPGDPTADPFVRRAMQHIPGLRKPDYPVGGAAGAAK